MIRKIALAGFTVCAMVLSLFSLPAEAQDDPTPTPTPVQCTQVGYNNCLAYPAGGFGDGRPTPTPRPEPTLTPVPVVTAADTAAAATDVAAPSIAFTGAESRVLGFVGAGMIGFGAVALAAARRRTEELN